MLKQAKYLVVALGLVGGAMGASQAVAQQSPLSCRQHYGKTFEDRSWIYLSCTAMTDLAVISKVVIDRGNKKTHNHVTGNACQASLKFGEELTCRVNWGRFIEAVVTVNGASWTYNWQPQ